MAKYRRVFYISDRTGITAETLGHSLITQFDDFEFHAITLPFVDTIEKAQQAVAKIDAEVSASNNGRPIVIGTIVNDEIRAIISQTQAFFMDLFNMFITPLETELNAQPSHIVGRSHSIDNLDEYNTRIDAVNFALENDDGANTKDFMAADVILVGVSRSGKTPTCLYLALTYGIRAANYPITEEDSLHHRFPKNLRNFKAKIVGLTIDPSRLHQIRQKRRPGSSYAELSQCQKEVALVEELFKNENVPYINSTSRSIEEISTQIMLLTGVERKLR